MLEGDDAGLRRRLWLRPAGDARGGAARCALSAGVACELAMESPMACGFGACFGCAVPLAGGGYMRLCVEARWSARDEIETALVGGAGHR